MAADYLKQYRDLYGNKWKGVILGVLRREGGKHEGPDKSEPWTEPEDALLLVARCLKGNRWQTVAELIPGR